MGELAVLFVGLAAAIGGCLFVLLRRGGEGERGALERVALQQETARAMSFSAVAQQNIGPGAGGF